MSNSGYPSPFSGCGHCTSHPIPNFSPIYIFRENRQDSINSSHNIYTTQDLFASYISHMHIQPPIPVHINPQSFLNIYISKNKRKINASQSNTPIKNPSHSMQESTFVSKISNAKCRFQCQCQCHHMLICLLALCHAHAVCMLYVRCMFKGYHFLICISIFLFPFFPFIFLLSFSLPFVSFILPESSN